MTPMTTNTDLHVAMPELPVVAYARRWFVNGEVPRKEKNAGGRMAWPFRFKLRAVTEGKCIPDDEPLVKLSDARAAIQQAAVPKTEDLRELLAKAPRLHAILTMGGCPSCGSKDCVALSCQLEPPKQQPDSQYSGYWPDTPPRPVQQPALGRGDGGGVPLSDEQIDALWDKPLTTPQKLQRRFMARAIEAAHGICKAPTCQINPDSAGQGMEAGEK